LITSPRDPHSVPLAFATALRRLRRYQKRIHTGHETIRPGVRRLATIPYPYLIDYRVTATEVIVMRFRHAARRPSG
jgi:plasmid stabilization system protein ParE